MKTSLLNNIHTALQANFADYAGWEMPRDYGDSLSEHLAVRNGVGVIDLSHRGKIKATGRDRVKFLHNLVSNEVAKLKPGEGNYSALLNSRGRLLADFRLYMMEDYILLDVDADNSTKLIREFTRYIIVNQVKLEDVSESLGLISVQGPKASLLLSLIFGEPMPDLAEHHHVKHQFNGLELIVVKTGYTGEAGYDIFTPVEGTLPLWNALFEKGKGYGVTPAGLAALDSLRIEAGVPRYGVDMDESYIASEAGLEKAISYSKGCFVGQEVVGRVKFRGHVNRLLVGMKVDGDAAPARGAKVYDGDQEIGHVTSSLLSPSLNRPLAMGYVRREFIEPGSKVAVEIGGSKTSAEVVELPFCDYSPE
jgi:glycine cleavage system T protein